jgi:hypothetical protein
MNASTLITPVIPPHPSSPNEGWLNGFPLRSFLELGAYRPAAGCARGHVRNVLAEWGLGEFTDAVTLIASELVTNAVTATSAASREAGLPPVRLWLLGSVANRGAATQGTAAHGASARGAGEVLILVWDAVAVVPEMGVAGAEDEAGRGLGIVHWLSGTQWDCYLPPAPYGGKVAWALIDCPWRDQPPG